MAPACGLRSQGWLRATRVVKERDGLYLEGVEGAVFVNNGTQPAPRHLLADEDLIRIGGVYLKFRRL